MNHDHSQGMGKHMLLMAICCLVPLGLILLVGTFGLSLGPLQGLLPFALVLMCPLMMIFMMRGMSHGNADDQGHLGDHSHHHLPAPRTPTTEQIPETAQGSAKTTAAIGQGKCH